MPMNEAVFLIYIHGFISSPQSAKAQLILRAMEDLGRGAEYAVPQLPFDPVSAIEKLEATIEQAKVKVNSIRIGLIGSSLGGYYATWLANKYKLKAVLVNPSVRPYESLKNYLGEVENLYTGERYTFESRHIEILKTFDVEKLARPEDFYLMVQTGDEVLDYRQAVEKYAFCRQEIQEGGSHGFDNFENMIPSVFQFLGINQ